MLLIDLNSTEDDCQDELFEMQLVELYGLEIRSNFGEGRTES